MVLLVWDERVREGTCEFEKYFNKTIIKNRYKKYYLNKRERIIDKLMWVFCKSDCVK